MNRKLLDGFVSFNKDNTTIAIARHAKAIDIQCEIMCVMNGIKAEWFNKIKFEEL